MGARVSFIWVEIGLHVEFHPPVLPTIGRFMVADKQRSSSQFHRINGFLSLQLELRLELGLEIN